MKHAFVFNSLIQEADKARLQEALLRGTPSSAKAKEK